MTITKLELFFGGRGRGRNRDTGEFSLHAEARVGLNYCDKKYKFYSSGMLQTTLPCEQQATLYHTRRFAPCGIVSTLRRAALCHRRSQVEALVRDYEAFFLPTPCLLCCKPPLSNNSKWPSSNYT